MLLNSTTKQQNERLINQQIAGLWKTAFEVFATKVASTLGSNHIPVKWVSGNYDAPAWTNGTEVSLNTDFYEKHLEQLVKTRNFSKAGTTVQIIKGLVFHELSHILWSPRGSVSGNFNLMEVLLRWYNDKSTEYRTRLYEVHSEARSNPPEFSHIADSLAKSTAQDAWVKATTMQKMYAEFGAQFVTNPHLVCNVLEDPRIEMRFLAKYPDATPYFTATVLHFIINELQDSLYNQQTSEHQPDFILMFPVLYGRKYIPSELVAPVRAKHDELIAQIKADGRNPLSTNEVCEIVDEYLRLELLYTEADQHRAFALIQKLTRHIDECRHTDFGSSPGSPETQPGSGDGIPPIDENLPAGGDGRKDTHPTTLRPSNREKKKDAQKTQEELEKLLEEYEKAEDADSSDSDGDDSDADDADSADDGKESGKSDSGNSGDNTKSGSDADSGSDSDKDSDNEPDSTNKAGKSGSGVSAKEELQTLAKELLEALGQELADRSNSDMASINEIFKGGSSPSVKPDLKGSHLVPITPKMKIASNRLASAIQRIWSDAEPAYEPEQQSGRINIPTLIKSKAGSTPNFHIFDQWNDSGDANDFEIVALVDQSSSMHGGWGTYGGDSLIMQVSKASWILRDMAHRLDIPAHVFGYNDQGRCLHLAGERVSQTDFHHYNSTGSTKPDKALFWALQIFQKSRAKHRLLFSLTDGRWAGGNSATASVLAMNALGVESFFVYMTGDKNSTVSEKDIRRQTGDMYGHTHYIPCGNVEDDFPISVAKVIARLSA